MRPTQSFIVATGIYVLACVGVLFMTKPWAGGDGSISFAVLINLLSIPSGLVATWMLSALTSAAHGTEFQELLTMSPFWWLFLLIGCGGLGYLQWFILFRLIARTKKRVLTNRPTRTPSFPRIS